MKLKKSTGFTLLEILLVVGIIAILAGIVIIAINPNKQLATTRNAQRLSDLKQINSALVQYYIDNNSYPASTTALTGLTEICNTGSVSGTTTAVTGVPCGSLISLSDLVPTYIVAIPVDPQSTSTLGFLDKLIPTAFAAPKGTGYKIAKDSNNKIGLTANLAEQNVVVSLGSVSATVAAGCMATGGKETTVGGYKIHTFTDVGNDTLTVNSGTCDVDVLVVAGGGSGGCYISGGGGSGGLISSSSVAISSQSYAIVVGDGGSAVGPCGSATSGNNGENSSFGDLITTIGGGGGGGRMAGLSGGSGGGAGQWYSSAVSGGLGTAGQGNNGGSQSVNGSSGGGGAGDVGMSGVDPVGGNGGAGLPSSISGAAVYYAGGGGGGASANAGASTGLGGNGGGGNGESEGTSSAKDGTPNTGGGGGGSWTSASGSGGSGIVIVRYAI